MYVQFTSCVHQEESLYSWFCFHGTNILLHLYPVFFSFFFSCCVFQVYRWTPAVNGTKMADYQLTIICSVNGRCFLYAINDASGQLCKLWLMNYFSNSRKTIQTTIIKEMYGQSLLNVQPILQQVTDEILSDRWAA